MGLRGFPEPQVWECDCQVAKLSLGMSCLPRPGTTKQGWTLSCVVPAAWFCFILLGQTLLNEATSSRGIATSSF